MERNLVHAEGDYFGQPFRLQPFQRKFVWEAYELRPDGGRRCDRALLGIPKGNGKTELAAAIGCAELGGPVVFDRWHARGRPIGKRRVSPDIPVAAASFDQADLLFGAAHTMIKEGPLSEFFDVYDTEILIKGAPGRMYRVAAIASTNDGGKPSFFLSDELHEWLGKKERVHLVISNGRAKRANSWELGITTAGFEFFSLLGRLVAYGRRVLAGEVDDDSFLFRWFEPHGEWECLTCERRVQTAAAHVPPAETCCGDWRKRAIDLTDPDALRAAIREANPAADAFLDVDAVAKRAAQIPDFEFRRYHLNQYVDSPDQWLPTGAWEARGNVERGVPADGAEVAIALEGSYDGTSVAIVGCTLEAIPHLFVIEAWEKDENPDWRFAIGDAEQSVRAACGRWRVKTIAMNSARWARTIEQLESEGLPAAAWDSHLAARMVPACAQFYDATVNGELTHDADERLERHIASAVIKTDARGPRIAKDHKDSDKRIECAIAAVAAYDCAVSTESGEDDAFRAL